MLYIAPFSEELFTHSNCVRIIVNPYGYPESFRYKLCCGNITPAEVSGISANTLIGIYDSGDGNTNASNPATRNSSCTEDLLERLLHCLYKMPRTFTGRKIVVCNDLSTKIRDHHGHRRFAYRDTDKVSMGCL
jgi:hypothetical protein